MPKAALDSDATATFSLCRAEYEEKRMEWSIQQLAKLAGTTIRTLRHYAEVGLLPPARIGANGYRYYDENSLVRLQRILLLRELGLGLPQIAEVLDRQTSEQLALEAHLAWLRQEQERLQRQIASVTSTIESLRRGTRIMAEKMFDGFDHTQYKDEVEERWGKDAYATSDAWWRGMSEEEKTAWKQRTAQLGADWSAAAQTGVAPDSASAQALAERHIEWLAAIPGTSASTPGSHMRAYVIGLGEMYVADPRFAANYQGEKGAKFVRDALRIYAEENL
jgi:MerR family transcriptional regulator, thiopeptide resistance regulator